MGLPFWNVCSKELPALENYHKCEESRKTTEQQRERPGFEDGNIFEVSVLSIHCYDYN